MRKRTTEDMERLKNEEYAERGGHLRRGKTMRSD